MSLKIIVVTPEKAVLDETADSVVLPMFDGERGVLAGHAAFVGQLAPGELRITTGSTSKRFYIDSGFVQVANNTVNVLTAKSLSSDKVTAELVIKARAEAEALPSSTAVERENRAKALARVSGMAKVSATA